MGVVVRGWGLGSGVWGPWQEVRDLGSRKLRAGVKEAVLRTWALRTCSPGGARSMLAPVCVSGFWGPKVVFLFEGSEILGPKVVELPQFLTPTCQNTR